MPSIFGNNLPAHSHSQGQGWGGSSLSTPSLWSSVDKNVNNLGDLGSGGLENDTVPGGLREPTVTGGKEMSAKEKLILQVMEEMEVARDVAVEIIGGEEEEEEEVDEVTKVVLIPKAQDKNKNFADIFDDETIEPLELKLRRRGPHGRVRPDVMCVEKGSEMIVWVWSIGVLSYIPRVAYHLPNAY